MMSNKLKNVNWTKECCASLNRYKTVIHFIRISLRSSLIFNLLLFSIFDCYSQVGKAIEWQNTIGANNGDNLSTIQQTTDGGYILGGYSFSGISGDKTQSNWDASLNSADYWIVKTDAFGNIQWNKTIGGSDADYFTDLQQTADGGFILGGESGSGMSGNKTENNLGDFDLWIVKIDASGNIQWDNTIGGNDHDELYSIQQTSDGGYIIASSSYSDISGDKTDHNWDPSGSSNDWWVIKIDESGNIQWQNDIGGDDDDYAASIQQTTDGGYIIGGSSSSGLSGDKTEVNNGYHDYWLVKLDPSGNILWQNTIGGSKYDDLTSLQQTDDGGYILGGNSESNATGDKTENSNGEYDYWIVKIDTAGNIQWQNAIGGAMSDWFYSIEQSTDGGYILGGYSYSNASGDKTENGFGPSDYWVVKIDSVGNIQWQNTLGGSSTDQLTSLEQTSDGGYILGGYSWSITSGNKTEDTHGLSDYWIIKLTDNFNTISGNTFIDLNSNGVQDGGEASLADKKITESNTGRFAFSMPAGYYELYVLDTGSFSVSPQAINYYNTVPGNQSAYFSSLLQKDSLNDFAFQPAGVFNDLNIQLNPMGSFRPGLNVNYSITYGNTGTTTLTPTIIFYPDSNLTFVSASINPGSITPDSIVWSLASLAPYYTGNILITVKVDSETVVGTSINSQAQIEPIINDENTADNVADWNSVVTTSHDPNAILVNRQTISTVELPLPPYLEYVIYFQNTGNDTAFNISIHNPIPVNLDVNTFEFVASSQPVSITYSPNEAIMFFTFANILLPDSSTNEPSSHGFIRYRIKPFSTLGIGDSIKNFCLIYFDLNAAVPTNTAITEIVLPDGSDVITEQNTVLKIFPNPATNDIIVQSSLLAQEHGLLIIYDLFGMIVFKSELHQPKTDDVYLQSKDQIKIKVSALPPGIYFIKLASDNNVFVQKFLKQ